MDPTIAPIFPSSDNLDFWPLSVGDVTGVSVCTGEVAEVTNVDGRVVDDEDFAVGTPYCVGTY